jgi:type I restriction enzyme, S subunit
LKSKQISALKDIAEIIMGQSPPGDSYNKSGEGLPFYQGVTDFGFRYPVKRQFCNEPKKIAKLDDILISVRAPIGSINITTEKCAIGRGIAIIRPHSKEDLLFIESFLKFKENKWEHLESGGTIFGNAKCDDLENLELFWPKKNLRIFIGNLFNNMTTKIENLKQQNQILEQITQSLFKSCFIDFDGQTEFVDSKLGQIPKGWEVIKISEIGYIGSGKRPRGKNDTQTSEYQIPCYGSSKIDGFVKESLFEKPLLITGRVGTLGVVNRSSVPCHPSDNTLIVLIENKIHFEYVFYCLKQIDFKLFNRGTSQPLIVQSDISNELILLPSENYLERFHKINKNIFKKCDQNNNQIKNLIITRDALLPKLMSGELVN